MNGSIDEHERNLNKYRQIMNIKERALENLEKEFYKYQNEFTYDDKYLREFDDEEFKPSFLKSNREM